MDLQDSRHQLEQMIREIEGAAATLEAEGAGESSELSHVDQHPADTAGEKVDLDNQNALLENGEDIKAQVLAALARLQAGTYGACVDCGRPIEPARLQARPEAARCLADQEHAEMAGLV